MSKLCERCGGTGLEPENDIPFVAPGHTDAGRIANQYQDLLTGPMGRPFTPFDTEGQHNDE